MTRQSIQMDENALVEEIRQRLKGVMSPEMYEDATMILRFLTARNFDIKATEEMIRNTINWRRERKCDTLLSWYTPHEVTENYLAISQAGFDKEGSPVLYCDVGNMDIRGLVKSVKTSEIENFVIRRMEEDIKILKKQTEKLNKPLDQWFYIYNFENFSLATATHKQTLETIEKIVSLYEANYPERLKKSIIINTSWYFQLAYAVIKPYLTAHTLQKVKIFGKDGWKNEILSLIDADTLPAFLGGNRTDPDGDPMCRTFIRHGAPVPEKYHGINNLDNFSNQTGVKKLIVNRFSKEEVPLLVSHPGSKIEWEFKTKAKDIAFSLWYKGDTTGDSEAKEVIPKQRWDTSISPEGGVFKCDDVGTYFLQFDNSHSWVYQKEVYYKVQVTSSDKQKK